MKKILTLNAGSSSIKFSIFDVENTKIASEPHIVGNLADIEDAPTFTVKKFGKHDKDTPNPLESVTDHDSAWEFLLDWLQHILADDEIMGVGHRVVHGGPAFCTPVILTQDIIKKLAALAPFAPGHQPNNLTGIKMANRLCPLSRHVACFDTAFHRTQPTIEQMFAIPRQYAQEGIVRYGFHGLSYEYISTCLPEILNDYPHSRVIVAHLGSGASMCAMVDGKSVATTMGLTSLDGLPMATRCGTIDPGVILHLIRERNMTVEQVSQCLYKQSGLLGISGISGDMRTLSASDAAEAAIAIDYFIHRVVIEVGSLGAAMGGLDALIFTGGIGENSATIRERVVNDLSWLGFQLDMDLNNAAEARISKEASTPSAWMVQTNEELIIARHTLCLLQEIP